jgi:hypothetical protein
LVAFLSLLAVRRKKQSSLLASLPLFLLRLFLALSPLPSPFGEEGLLLAEERRGGYPALQEEGRGGAKLSLPEGRSNPFLKAGEEGLASLPSGEELRSSTSSFGTSRREAGSRKEGVLLPLRSSPEGAASP